MKNIFYSWLCVSLVLVCFCAIGCNKAIEDKNISDEMRSWIAYDYGTYWLFKDSASGILDSVVPTHGIYQNATTEDKKYRYHHGGISLYEYSIDSGLMNGGFGINVDATQDENVSRLLYRNKIGEVGYEPFLILPIIHGGTNHTYGYRDQNMSVVYLGSYTMSGHTFDSVYKFIYSFPNNSKTEYFLLNRKEGFIKLVQDNEIVKRTLVIQKWNVIHK